MNTQIVFIECFQYLTQSSELFQRRVSTINTSLEMIPWRKAQQKTLPGTDLAEETVRRPFLLGRSSEELAA